MERWLMRTLGFFSKYHFRAKKKIIAILTINYCDYCCVSDIQQGLENYYFVTYACVFCHVCSVMCYGMCYVVCSVTCVLSCVLSYDLLRVIWNEVCQGYCHAAITLFPTSDIVGSSYNNACMYI